MAQDLNQALAVLGWKTERTSQKLRTGATKQHVMQSRGQSALVFHIGDIPLTIHVVRLDPLGIVDDNTARSVLKQQLLINQTTPLQELFLYSGRLSCTDSSPLTHLWRRTKHMLCLMRLGISSVLESVDTYSFLIAF